MDMISPASQVQGTTHERHASSTSNNKKSKNSVIKEDPKDIVQRGPPRQQAPRPGPAQPGPTRGPWRPNGAVKPAPRQRAPPPSLPENRQVRPTPGRIPPPRPAQPVHVNPEVEKFNGSIEQREGVGWKYDLVMDCCHDTDICCCGYWCPCVLAGRNAKALGEQYFLFCVCSLFFPAIMIPLLRIKARKKMGIVGSATEDFLLAWWNIPGNLLATMLEIPHLVIPDCLTCMNCQIANELKYRKSKGEEFKKVEHAEFLKLPQVEDGGKLNPVGRGVPGGSMYRKFRHKFSSHKRHTFEIKEQDDASQVKVQADASQVKEQDDANQAKERDDAN